MLTKQITAKRRPVDDIDRAFSRVERLTAVGSTIGALEQLVRREKYDDNGLFSWPVNRTRLPGSRRTHYRYIDKVLSYPRFTHVMRARFASGAGLLAGGSRRSRAVCLAGMTGTGTAINLRSNYGLDGSDDLAYINYAVAMLEKLFPNDRQAREYALAFIAFQSCLSYFTSGAVKMTSSMWRNGDALTGIFRTQTYGDKFFYDLIKDRPGTTRLLAWSVMVAEAAFPLVLLMPKPIARLFFLTGMAFHVSNAKFMGLNRFFWSFVATYPAVSYFTRDAIRGRKAA